MRVDELDYELPEALIAQAPLQDRGAARMLVVGAPGAHAHRAIADLAALVPEGALLVVNDTRVIPARLRGQKDSGGKAEIFLLERLAPDGSSWKAMGRASKGLRPGMRVTAGALALTVTELLEGGLFVVRAETTEGAGGESVTVDEELERTGHVPLPPYIRREDDAADRHRYQTIFAQHDGAVAAPTAGLHLTEELLALLRARGVLVAKVTLHVGLGTFQPVTVEDLDHHPMHAERFTVSPETEALVASARARRAPVMCVGTTSVRALESAADPARPGHVRAQSGETRLLIQPGYSFRVTDLLLTNFHLPKSTLLALVSAFGGTDSVRSAYAEAVRERYRFFSYGDAMLLSRWPSKGGETP